MSLCHILWNSFKQNICTGFSRFQQKEEFVDMTLAADGHLVKVHRNLMALASPYIKDMLQSAPCQHPILFLNNVSQEILSYLLEYIYTGEVQVPLDKTSSFVDAAKALHIVGIENVIPPMSNTGVTKKSRRNKNILNRSQYVADIRPNPQHTNSMFDTTQDEIQLESPERNNPDLSDIQSENESLIEVSNNETTVENQFILPEINERSIDSTHLTRDTKTNELNQTKLSINTKYEEPQISHIHDLESINNKFYNINQENNTDTHDGMNQKNHNINFEINFKKYDRNESTFVTNSIGIIKIEDEVKPDCQAKEIFLPTTHIFTEKSKEVFHPINSVIEAEPQSSFNNLELGNNNHIQMEQPRFTINVSNIEMNSEPTARINCNPARKEADVEDISTLYTVSNRGAVQLILNRYMYNLHHTSHGGRKRRWRCINYRKYGCKAFADTDGEIMTCRKYNHGHHFHDIQIIKKGHNSRFFTTIAEVVAHCGERYADHRKFDKKNQRMRKLQ